MVIANSKENIIILPTGSTLRLSDSYGIDSYKCEMLRQNTQHNCEYQHFFMLAPLR